VLGLKKKTTAPAPAIAVPKTTPAKIASDGCTADFIIGGTVCGSQRMIY
jgi:hypothetical protein